MITHWLINEQANNSQTIAHLLLIDVIELLVGIPLMLLIIHKFLLMTNNSTHLPTAILRKCHEFLFFPQHRWAYFVDMVRFVFPILMYSFL